MIELNLKQIVDKLNIEFIGESRKLVFWYDSNSEFISDIDTMELENAKVLKLEPDNQFYIKYFLEREDKTTNYLIYAPFAKPSLKENHLADTIRYSKEFFADRASLLVVDLGIDEKYKIVLQHYIKFFRSKERTQKFYDLEIEKFNQNIIELALMSVICKVKRASFEEIMRVIIVEEDLNNNKYLAEFEKYDLLNSFWKMCEKIFGYTDATPTLSKLIYTFFVTYTSKVIYLELPQAWKNYCSYKAGNIIAFLDSLMNSLVFKERFDKLSEFVYKTLNGDSIFEKLEVSDFVELQVFSKVDQFIIRWIIDRLENENTDANLNGYSIPELCKMRRKMHYGEIYYSHYYILENAYYLIMEASYKPKNEIQDIWKQYISKDYRIDQKYRYFYYHYDKLMSSVLYENLRDLIENIYTNRYLNPLSVAWNKAFFECKANTDLNKQQYFYNNFIKELKERVVVIISDAFRFEVGQTLFKKLTDDEKYNASIMPMQSVIPSYTRFGMAALLPHKSITMNGKFEILVDGSICDDLKSREKKLQNYNLKSRAIQFDNIKNMKVAELRDLFKGQEVIYIYHNQIDARGDKLNTENEVFIACEEAVEEIYTMIKRLSSINNNRFMITADHGFIYKRDKLIESDKISGFEKNDSLISKRYVISNKELNVDGIGEINLRNILKNDDSRIISTPIGSDIFKVSGGGQNFVHGGSSLQEILIPMIDVKINKNNIETKPVEITLLSLVNKITNLTTNLDFIQTEPVNNINKKTTYKLFFISDKNEKISNDNIYIADKKDVDASKRIFRLKFIFKNQKYDRTKKYYLVVYDEIKSLEVIRKEVQMDLAFSDDFGFNI